MSEQQRRIDKAMSHAYNSAQPGTWEEQQQQQQAQAAPAQTPRPELSFDGCGINGPDEYRTRLATFNRTPDFTDAVINRYGALFAAAPDTARELAQTRAACDALAQALRGLYRRAASLNQWPTNEGKLNRAAVDNARAALAQYEEAKK